MTNLRLITGKYLEEKLKKGHRLKYFLNVTGCSEQELFDHIDRTFSSKAAKAYKKRLKSKGTPQKKTKTTKITKEVEIKGMENSIEIASECEGIHEPEKTALELLLEKEEQLSSELCESEAHHADKISRRAVLKSMLKEQHQKMKELTEKILQVQSDFEATVSEWISVGKEMRVLSTSISEKRTQLGEIRSEIDSLKKISIFVYSNGEIEFENQGSFDSTVDSSKVNELFSTLVQNEAAESLTIKSLKQLAKVLAIVEKLTAENLKFALEFDETAMKEVYDIVSQEN